ncbi:T9SS type B sorting domain-containing protein [Cryomorpha ignava]|uniref:T9SS type B sorting domain-containing protein n=1 Tax=Cryomorpha ignava TaxID=101383 RepID=A0A7K3WQN2_9FLAO|nr:choice-of-anchor L domain-containing protein [Cryomorpha ignava]NEN23970.1 T9SS type B sorting domain-containing protein [Cryomorpha ignava]
MLKRLLSTSFIFAFIAVSTSLTAQIQIDTTLTPEQLVQDVLLGNGVSVSNITFNGQPANTLNAQAAHYIGPSNFVEFPEGILLKSGHAFDVQDPTFFPPFNPPFPDPNIQSDNDLEDICGQNINNAAILEFDFVPNGDSLVFRYVFASQEYPSFTCSSFNDAFGFFISGPGINGPFENNAINLALIPGTNIPVAINTVNSGTPSGGNAQPCLNANPNFVEDSQYFVENGDEPEGDIQFPGMTVALSAFANVLCGETYHIKLAIADASDGALDSGVFLEAGSFTSNSSVQVNLDIPVGVNDSTLYEGCGSANLQFIRPGEGAGLLEIAYLDISGSAINGVDYIPMLPDSVIFPAGVDTVTFELFAPNDANFEGEEFAHIQITNIASDCSGAVVTSEFQFYVNEAEPLQVSGFDGTLIDCHDDIQLFPTVSGGYGEYNYSWSNGMNTDSVTVSPGQTTTFFLVVSDTCGVNAVQTTFDVEVPVYPPVQVVLPEDFEVAQCDVTVNLIPQVSGGFGNYDYYWTGNGALISENPALNFLVEETTDIVLVATDDCDATGSDDIRVTIPQVEITAFLPDAFEANSCLEDILLPAIAEGGIGQKKYVWIVDGISQDTTLSTYFMYSPSMGQNVVIKAIDECENFGSDSTFIPFNFPEVEITASADTSICPKTTALLQVDVLNGSGGYHIDWGDSDSTSYLVKPKGDQNYTVVVTDTCGMRAEKRINVRVREVKADFDYIYKDYYGLEFTNYSRAINPTFFWNFGDEETSTERNPIHFYEESLPYRVMLTTTDDIGCRDSVFFRTIPPLEIFIPTSFTPNGDGINDLFGVEGSNIKEFSMRIYDRWGHLVFHANDIDEKWNGANNDDGYHSGAAIYSYFIRYKGEKEEDAIEVTGNITVIR